MPEDDLGEIRTVNANREKVRAHFAQLRAGAGEGWGPFKFNPMDQKRHGMINSLELECLEKAGSPSANVDELMAKADREIEKEVGLPKKKE